MKPCTEGGASGPATAAKSRKPSEASEASNSVACATRLRARVREAEALAQGEARDVRDGDRRGHRGHLRLVGAEDEREPEPHEQQHAREGVAHGRGAGVGGGGALPCATCATSW